MAHLFPRDDTKTSRSEFLKAVDDTFEAAKEEPVHPSKPELRPVEILPVFPDEDLWAN